MKGNYTYYLKGVADRGSEQIQNPETDFYFLKKRPRPKPFPSNFAP